jgi:hypothetical protein
MEWSLYCNRPDAGFGSQKEQIWFGPVFSTYLICLDDDLPVSVFWWFNYDTLTWAGKANLP